MKHFISQDGKHLVATLDSYDGSANSPAVHIPLGDPRAKTIQAEGFRGLKMGALLGLYSELKAQEDMMIHNAIQKLQETTEGE